MAGERPLGVTLLAILGFLGGIFGVLSGITATVFTGAYFPLLGGSEIGMMGTTIAAVVGGGAIVVGIISMAVAWGLWTGKKWAWWIEVIFSALSVLSILALNIVGAVIGAVILWYFFKPHVKEYFGVDVEFST